LKQVQKQIFNSIKKSFKNLQREKFEKFIEIYWFG